MKPNPEVGSFVTLLPRFDHLDSRVLWCGPQEQLWRKRF